MGRLYLALSGLTLAFSASMSFAVLAVYDLSWWPGVVAAALVVVVLAAGAGSLPRALRHLSGGKGRTGRVAVIWASSLWGLELFSMALITWGLGKRELSVATGAGNAYQTLGLVIFLGFLGAGIGGFLAMTAYFFSVRNEALVVPARRESVGIPAAQEMVTRQH